LLREIESLNERIKQYDRRIEKMAKETYPETALLKQVKGVGGLIATAYVLTIEDLRAHTSLSVTYIMLRVVYEAQLTLVG
jgi:transposase